MLGFLGAPVLGQLQTEYANISYETIGMPEEYTVKTWEWRRHLPFDDPEGGPWRQGFPINVHVSYFSHLDVGWQQTIEEYNPTVWNIFRTYLKIMEKNPST